MIDTACPFCGGHLTQSLWRPAFMTMSLSGPWPAQYYFNWCSCPQCGQQIKALVTTYEENVLHLWTEQDEIFRPWRDYDVIESRRRVLGDQPLRVSWQYYPAEARKSVEDQRLVEVWQSTPPRADESSICVIAPGLDVVPALHNETFDQIWQLRPHVMEGAKGPYPSLRAERSLMATFATLNLRWIAHMWPAVSLPEAWYWPLVPLENLAALIPLSRPVAGAADIIVRH